MRKTVTKSRSPDIGDEPPLPKGDLISARHSLVLIPTKVNNKPLTLKMLSELFPRQKLLDKDPNRYKLSIGKDLQLEKILHKDESYWALVTRDVLPNTLGKDFIHQQKQLPPDYKVPSVLETLLFILIHHFDGQNCYPSQNQGDQKNLVYTRSGFSKDDKIKVLHEVTWIHPIPREQKLLFKERISLLLNSWRAR